MERIPISEWEQQADKPSHATQPANVALAIMKYDDNDNIAPTVSECRSDIAYYPTPAPQPAANDKQERPDDTTSSFSVACPVSNTPRSTNTNRLNDDDEEDSDEEIGAMIYASSNTARARRVAAKATSAANGSNQSSSSYEPHSEVRKRKSLSDSSSNEMESASKKKRVTTYKSFEQRIADLKTYKEKHGHVNVKWRDDRSLYGFCKNIRYGYNNPGKSRVALTDDRIASLDAFDFDWTERGTKSFEQRIADLQAYKEKHGHLNIRKSEDRSLYDFCNHMRRARINPEKSTFIIINDERIASLDALGFNWSAGRGEAATKSFEQRIADLKAYKKKNGHLNVKGKEDKSLSDFCYNVRYARINPEKMTTLINEERIASLDALGFEWTPERDRKSFVQRIDDLQAYKEKHGHVNVKQSEDRSLYDFCSQMRRARSNPEKSNTVINDDRIASLDALGFDWLVERRVETKSFEQRMDDLRAYKEKHEHVNVKEREDKSLYKFCSNMRHARKHPEKSDRTLTDDRIASLDALGFDWNIQERKSFEQRIEDLRAYKEKNGHVKVKGSDDKSLNKFCRHIRHARNNPEKSNMAINEERIASLDAVGFDWS